MTIDIVQTSKQTVKEIISSVYCNLCRSGQDQPCNISFPQANVPEHVEQQIRLVAVHKERFDVWSVYKAKGGNDDTLKQDSEPSSTKLNQVLPITTNSYQDWTDSTAIYQGTGKLSGLVYCVLGLTGEAGEFADKVKKIIRGGDVSFDYFTKPQISIEAREKLLFELGDVLWYVSRCARELGASLESVALMNYLKLEERKSKDQLHRHDDKR